MAAGLGKKHDRSGGVDTRGGDLAGFLGGSGGLPRVSAWEIGVGSVRSGARPTKGLALSVGSRMLNLTRPELHHAVTGLGSVNEEKNSEPSEDRLVMRNRAGDDGSNW